MSVRAFVFATLFLFMAPGPLSAQALVPTDRVRVVLRETQRQDETPLLRRLVLRGQVTRIAGDSIFFRPDGTSGDLGIARGEVLALHRSLGVRSRARNAARWGFFYALTGAVMTGTSYREPDHMFGVINRGEAIALGAGVGAVTGIAFGALLPTERWQRVRR